MKVRMYANVIVWSNLVPHTSEAFFVLTTHGTICEIKSHREVTESQYLEYIAFSSYLGKAITYEICNDDYVVVQRANTPNLPNPP